MRAFVVLFLLCLGAGGNSLPSEKRKNGVLIQGVLAPVQVKLQESSAVFYNLEDSRPYLYGTVVSSEGHIFTKLSEWETVSKYYVRVGSKKYRSPEVVGRSEEWDLVLIKIDGEGLTPVLFEGIEALSRGTWVVSNGATERRFRRPRPGIISANQRAIPDGDGAVLGLGLDFSDDQILVVNVAEDSDAFEVGLKEDDVLISLDGAVVEGQEAVEKILADKKPGELVKVSVERGEETLEFSVKLMSRLLLYAESETRNEQMSGGNEQLSARRTGFPMVLQHDTTLTRRSVGGPVFTLDGEFVGMNIACASRVASYAIPAAELAKVLGDLKP